ncbi:DnaJ domain-containing protein [Tumidithrix elongata RA019]|uniref:DnaJ domain-containing protein n=1 Tax=Tumidithrix elongata BACA0141 TaxID=2716417 RepID=A0AAW9PY62_9CYAN|nr:DnaJ domain-containing protein [Tumidithrix elongata RA019]
MVQQPKTFRIDRGIGQYDFNDYYAVLGLPVTATAGLVRKRYLTIAKNLHPDIFGRSPDEKVIAGQYLSKLVNPAYNVLNQERERTEYSAILKLLAKRLMKRNQKFVPQSEVAKKLLQISNVSSYEQAVQDIAKIQYEQLDKILEYTAQLSELNLVYVLLQEGYKPFTSEEVAKSSSMNGDTTTIQPPSYTSKNYTSSSSSSGSSYRQTSGTNASYPNTGNTTSFTQSKSTQSGSTQSRPTGASQSNSSQYRASQDTADAASNSGSSSIQQNIRQAELFIAQKEWSSALKELRSAIQIDCNNSKCHALLGVVYVNQKLAGMAKVSFQQALKLNPQEPIALKYMSQLGSKDSSSQSTTQANANTNKKDSNKKGGFFGWLGGQ